MTEYSRTPSSFEQFMTILNSSSDMKVRSLIGDDMFEMYSAARRASESDKPVVMSRLPYGMRINM